MKRISGFVRCHFCDEIVHVDDCMLLHQQEIIYPMLGDDEYVCDDCDPIETNKEEV